MSGILGFVGYQVVWLAIVLSARADRPWLGVGAAALYVAAHVALLSWTDAIGFPRPAPKVIGSTVWMAALWLTLGTLLTGSLGWLAGRPVLAATLGFILGPVAYRGGARLDLLVVDGAWLVAMPLLMALAERFAPRRDRTGASAYDSPTPGGPT